MLPLLLILLLTLPFLCRAAPGQPFNVTAIDENELNRHYSISTTSPTSRALRNAPPLREKVRPSYELFERLWKVIEHRRNVSHPLSCNLRQNDWVSTGVKKVQIFQIAEFNESCQSRLDLSDAVARGELDAEYVDNARDLIVDAKDALFEAMSPLPELPDKDDKDLNWTRGHFKLRWNLRRVSQECDVDSLFAYRVNGEWYVLSNIANTPMDAYMRPWELSTISEYIREDLSSSLTLPWIRLGTEDEVESGTTFFYRGSGKVSLASTASMDFDDNPAIDEALRLNAIAVDQAEDAITPSNIAILALPMVMSLVPVAFIADLNTWAMLLYIIFTDVFAALPFLIKGVELLDSSASRRGEVVAYHMGNATVAQMELWAAECHGKDSFRILGISFICIATASIIVGIVLELIAGRIMNKRRASGGKDALGPFGMAMFDITAYSMLGAAAAVENQRDVGGSLDMEPSTSVQYASTDGFDERQRPEFYPVESYDHLEDAVGDDDSERGSWWRSRWGRRRNEGATEDGQIAEDDGDEIGRSMQSPDVSYDTGRRRDAFGFDWGDDFG